MNKHITVLLAFSILLFSCKLKKEKKTDPVVVEKTEEVQPKQTINMDEIVGDFSITSLKDIPEFNEVSPSVKIEETGKISGFNGCNSFFGKIDVEAESLLNNLGATRKACEGEGSEVEMMMMNLLKEVTHISVEDIFIKFYMNNEVVISGKKISLERGTWEVISLGEKEFVQMPTFNIENRNLNGHTGCNSFFAMVDQNGFKIKILEPGATEMACEGFDMAMETKFINALGEVTEYKMEGPIAIFSKNGKELFRAKNPEQE